MSRNINLPSWAKVIAPGKIEVDASVFYPEILEELWADKTWPTEVENTLYEGLQRTEVDQYWLEVAFQVAKMDIQMAISGTELMPEKGGALVIIIKDSTKKSNNGVSIYAQKNAPKGRDVKVASNGREAREHFKRIRTVLF